MVRGRPSRCRVLLVFFATWPSLVGCWSFQVGPGEPETPSFRADSPAAILRVSEAGIPWANGELGPAIQESLLAHGVFRAVHFPTEPRDGKTAVVVEVVGLGGVDEAVLWAALAAGATGYFFFLPALVLPFFQDYEAEVEVRVRRDESVLGSFRLAAEANIVHAMFAGPGDYVPKARKSVIRHLAGDVAAGVAEIAAK